MFSTLPRKRVAAPAILVISALLPADHSGADFTWNGGGSPNNNFTEPTNWNPDGAPVGFDLMSQSFIFGPTAGDDQTPNAQGFAWTGIGGLAFTGADAAYTINGTGSFTFNDLAVILNDSATAHTINVDLVGTGDSLVINAMAGDLTIGGDITLSDTDMNGIMVLTVQGGMGMSTTLAGRIIGEDGSLLKLEAGTLTLNGNNSYTGGTTLTAGTIVLGNDNALGTGDLTVTGFSSIQASAQTGITRRISNDIKIGNAITLTVSGLTNLELRGVISDLNDMGAGVLNVDLSADGTLLTLTGENTYTGGTTLSRGTIVRAHESSAAATITARGAPKCWPGIVPRVSPAVSHV